MSYFDDWRDATPVEKGHIDLLNAFIKELIAAHAPVIHCVLGHGSFFRREFSKHSDIDLNIIVNTAADIPAVKNTIVLFCAKPGCSVLSPKCLSIEALKTGKASKAGEMSPSRFISLSKEYTLLWGKPLPYKQLVAERTASESLVSMIQFVLSREKTAISDMDVAKLYLFVIRDDNKYRGITDEFSYNNIAKQYPPSTLPHKAVLVVTTSGEFVPAGFRQAVFDNLRKRLAQLTQ